MLKTKKQIKRWLNKHRITNYTINDYLTVDVNRSVYLSCENLTEIPIQFNKVNGDFWCDNNLLTSLIGAPEEIHGYFYCFNNKLTSLKGSPKKVSGSFSCHNNQLTSLEGSPQKNNGDFLCYNNQLTSLVGAPKEVKGDFWCDSNSLTSLEYLPEIHGKLVCDDYLHNTREYKVYLISKQLRKMV